MTFPTVGRHIRINSPGAGGWIMGEVGGVFRPECDHSIANFNELGEILGGFALTGYTSRTMVVHMAGRDPTWCSRDLLWMLFDYAFHQVKVAKVLATVSTGNPKAIALDMRAGFRVVAMVPEVYEDGDMLILSMDAAHCKWLNLKSNNYCRSDNGKEFYASRA
jgi:hypothetical protein